NTSASAPKPARSRFADQCLIFVPPEAHIVLHGRSGFTWRWSHEVVRVLHVRRGGRQKAAPGGLIRSPIGGQKLNLRTSSIVRGAPAVVVIMPNVFGEFRSRSGGPKFVRFNA